MSDEQIYTFEFHLSSGKTIVAPLHRAEALMIKKAYLDGSYNYISLGTEVDMTHIAKAHIEAMVVTPDVGE